MEITTLVFLLAFPIAFFSWMIRFKGIMVLFVIAPLVFLLATVLYINAEGGLVNTSLPALNHTSTQCFTVRMNATVNAAGNVTTYGNDIQCRTITDSYPIPANTMLIINFTMMAFVLTTVVLVYRRLSAESKKNLSE